MHSKNQLRRRAFLGTAISASAAFSNPAVPAQSEPPLADRTGADFMVTILQSLGLEYVALNPGSSFRALHESIVNFGGNRNPQLLTCCHEEAAVALADGYARVEGRPMAAMVHTNVGLQHASMAIYNAYAGRIPIFILAGNTIDAAARRPGGDWNHSAQDVAALVRDFTKWDDLPISLTHFAESAMRAYRLAVTPPMGPVVLVADSELQERPAGRGTELRIPKLTLASAPAGDPKVLTKVAQLLVQAEHPVILAERMVRSPAGMQLLIELAETIQAPVTSGKFPNQHPLSQAANRHIGSADVILGLEVPDFWGATHSYRDQAERSYRSVTKAGAKLISISTQELNTKANQQSLQRYAELDFDIVGDAEASLPTLIDACKQLLTPARRSALEQRARALAKVHDQTVQDARAAASYGWDASPVSTARVSAEVWEVIRHRDWALVGGQTSRLWYVDQPYQTMGLSPNGPGFGGAGGIGFMAPAAVGGALAHRKYGRFCVSLQSDGDLMYSPGVLWTAAHHRIPLMIVMLNNRAYHSEVMHVQRMANRNQRGVGNAGVGTLLSDPNIDYAAMARSLGIYGVGPIADPTDLGSALRKAAEVVAGGEPALIDVVTQPR